MKTSKGELKQKGGIGIWIFFVASGIGRLAVIVRKMNSRVCEGILQDNVRLADQLRLGRRRSWAMQYKD